MIGKKFSFAALAVAASWSPVCLGESLEDAWGIALGVDYRLQAAHNQAEAAQDEWQAAKTLRLPRVTADLSQTFLSSAPTGRVEVPGLGTALLPFSDDHFLISNSQVSLPLFTGGRIRNTVRAAQATAEAARANISSTEEDVKLRVAEAYISVLRASRLVEIAAGNVASLVAHEKDATNLMEQGLVPRNDVLAAEATLADARLQELQALNALDISRASYNRLLGRSLTDPVTVDDLAPRPVDETLEALTARALHSRVELEEISHQAAALQFQAGAVLANRLPQLEFKGGETYIQSPLLNKDSYWFATLGLKWEIFDFGEKKLQAGALHQQTVAAERLRSDAVSTIRLEVRKSWLDVRETQKQIEVARKSLEQAEENLRVAKERYTEGVGTNTEVLDAEALRTRSRSNYATAFYDAVLAGIELRRAVGIL